MAENQDPIAPPRHPGELPELNEPPRWPKVVGTISLVYAGLLLTCSGCGVLGMVVGPMFMQGEGQPELPPTMRPSGLVWLHMAFGFLLLGLLLAAGILTLSRKPAGRLLHLVWGGLSIPSTLVGVALQWQQQQAMIQWAKDNPDNPFAKGQAEGSPLAMAMLLFFLLVGLAWPVFCLVWFGMIKRDPKSMGGDELPPAA